MTSEIIILDLMCMSPLIQEESGVDADVIVGLDLDELVLWIQRDD